MADYTLRGHHVYNLHEKIVKSQEIPNFHLDSRWDMVHHPDSAVRIVVGVYDTICNQCKDRNYCDEEGPLERFLEGAIDIVYALTQGFIPGKTYLLGEMMEKFDKRSIQSSFNRKGGGTLLAFILFGIPWGIERGLHGAMDYLEYKLMPKVIKRFSPFGKP